MNEKTCRICCINEGSSYIFDNEVFQISKRIMYCCPKIRIIEGDGLPAYICQSCERDLSISYSFILKCETSDLTLRSIFVNDFSIKFIEKRDCQSQVKVKLEENYNSECDQYDELQYEPLISNDTKNLKLVQLDVKLEKKVIISEKNKTKIHKKSKRYKPKIWECNVCGQVCSNPSTLIAHKRKHTDEKPFQCPSCDKKYKDKGSLKRHTERNHSETERNRDYMCENCGKSFFSKTDVKTHMRIHTGETPYACHLCPKQFTQISALLRHKKRHSGVKSHMCLTCNKKFCTKDEVRNHQKVHTDEKKFPCAFCNSLFKYKNNLKKHMILHLEPNRFICNYCGRMFNVKGNLKLHIDRQHSEKSGYCDKCSKSVSNLEVHMWRHTGERPLKCKLCTSSFYELKALAHHINFRHENTDKHKCCVPGCNMSFPSRPMLDFHNYKVHETVIPFPCDRCSRGFYRKNDLARHKKGTHKEMLAG